MSVMLPEIVKPNLIAIQTAFTGRLYQGINWLATLLRSEAERISVSGGRHAG